MSKIRKYLLISQISLLGLLAICCFIMPSVVSSNGGVSNFGNHLSTVVLYILAFVLSIIFIFLVAYKLLKTGSNYRLISYVLITICLLEFLVLISTFPRRYAWIYSEIHDGLGVALYAFQFLFAGWLVFKQRNLISLTAITIQVIGSLIGVITLAGLVHLLFIGQMIGAIGFALIMTLVLPPVIKATANRTIH